MRVSQILLLPKKKQNVNIVLHVALNMADRSKMEKSLKMEIVTHFKKNLSIRAIADIVSCSKSVVGRIVKEYKESGCVTSAKTRGRPRKTSSRQDRIIQRTGLKDRFASAASISREMKAENNMDVSRFTISRRLNEIGLYARRPQKKPLISAKNKLQG